MVRVGVVLIEEGISEIPSAPAAGEFTLVECEGP